MPPILDNMAFNRGNGICRLLDDVDMSKQLDEIIAVIEGMVKEIQRANEVITLRAQTELLENVDKSVSH